MPGHVPELRKGRPRLGAGLGFLTRWGRPRFALSVPGKVSGAMHPPGGDPTFAAPGFVSFRARKQEFHVTFPRVSASTAAGGLAGACS